MRCSVVYVCMYNNYWSKPEQVQVNRPCAQNNGIYVSISTHLSIYLSMYHLPCIFHTLGCPEMLRVFLYIDMLTCMIYICTQLNSKDDWSYSLSAMKIIDKDRYVNVQTHGINKFSLLKQCGCCCPATCQRTCVNQKRLMG